MDTGTISANWITTEPPFYMHSIYHHFDGIKSMIVIYNAT